MHNGENKFYVDARERKFRQNDSKNGVGQEKIAVMGGDNSPSLFESIWPRQRNCEGAELDLQALGHLNKDENKC